MWVKAYWIAAFLAAVGIQKAIGNNPVHSALTIFGLVFIICFVYFHRPPYLWGEWDPPVEEIVSIPLSEEEKEMIDEEDGAEDDEMNYLVVGEDSAEDDEMNNLVSSEIPVIQRLDPSKRESNQKELSELRVERVTFLENFGDIQLLDISNERQRNQKEVHMSLRTERIHFLNNVKIFLTFMVVCFHVGGAFGGLGKNWTLVIGLYEKKRNKLTTILEGLNMVNQSYFMSLFFFISGVFTPSNYARKGGEQFVKDRAKRLLIPALVTTFVLVPLTTIIAQWSASFRLLYIPFPEHTWFIFWLLLFEWGYVTINKDQLRSNRSSRPVPFPNTLTRCCWGLLLCGLATYYFAIEAKIKMFWSMPTISPGSVFCDILLFIAGTVAKESGWISSESTIAEQLDLPLWAFRCIVIVEGCYVFLLKVSPIKSTAFQVMYFLVAGVFCIDMSIFVLQAFQQYASKPLPAFFSEAAFTVYLIHPLVITVCTSFFVKAYNGLYDNRIEFDSKLGGIFAVSQSHLSGPMDGMFHLFIGFLIVLAMSNMTVWPVAWLLQRLPILNQYL